MPTSFKPIRKRAYVFNVGLVDQANTKLLKAAPTLAAGDFKISKDGGAFANLATLPTVTPAGGVGVKISLSATEMDADNVVITCIDAAGAEWCDQMIDIQTREQAIGFFHFVMIDTSGNPFPGATVTFQRVIDDGTFGSFTGTSYTDKGNGVYCLKTVPLADLDGEAVTIRATASGCRPTLISLTTPY